MRMIDFTPPPEIPKAIIEFAQTKSIFRKLTRKVYIEYLGEISKYKIYLKTKENCLKHKSTFSNYIIDDGQNIRYSSSKERQIIQEFDTKFHYYNEIQKKEDING